MLVGSYSPDAVDQSDGARGSLSSSSSSSPASDFRHPEGVHNLHNASKNDIAPTVADGMTVIASNSEEHVMSQFLATDFMNYHV